ncbi:MAG: diguanylate cyclase domain-containing protein, partial [Hyphomicrobiaceae bacterium]
MTARFIPPEKQVRLKYLELLQLGDDDDPLWQHIRLAQLSDLYSHRFANVGLALIYGVTLIIIMGNRISPLAIGWVLASTVLAIFLITYMRHQLKQPVVVTRADVRRALIVLMFISSSWSITFFVGLAHATDAEARLLLAMAVGSIACMSLSTSSWPLGSIALWGVVSIGTLAGVFVHGSMGPLLQGSIGAFAHEARIEIAIAVVLLGYILFAARNTMISTRNSISRLYMRERMREQEEVLRLVLHEFETNGQEWLFDFNARGRLNFASARSSEALRRPADDVIGWHWLRFLAHGADAAELKADIRAGRPFRDHVLRVDINGEVRWWNVSGTPKVDRDGRLTGYRGVGADVTDRQLAAEKIAELATFDALTGLVNRRIIHQALADALESSSEVVLLFVDLDRFKCVNDSLGHAAGDRLLGEVASRMRNQVTMSAGSHALVGRLGGDEFAILLRGCSEEAAIAIGEDVIEAVSRPYYLGGKLAQVGASIGLALGPRDAATVEGMMRAADLALYDVKALGRGRGRPYDRAVYKRVVDRRALALDLRSAVDEGQLRLAF